jgi:D-amino-acid dehydrogenase
VTIRNPRVAPDTPVMPQEAKTANTKVHDGFRLAGQVELAGVDASPNWRRAEILLVNAKHSYPALQAQADMKIDTWMGHRPSTPDGKPLISVSRKSPDIVYAFGYGHIGPATALTATELVLDLVTNGVSEIDASPFRTHRF